MPPPPLVVVAVVAVVVLLPLLLVCLYIAAPIPDAAVDIFTRAHVPAGTVLIMLCFCYGCFHTGK